MISPALLANYGFEEYSLFDEPCIDWIKGPAYWDNDHRKIHYCSGNGYHQPGLYLWSGLGDYESYGYRIEVDNDITFEIIMTALGVQKVL